MIYIFTFLGEFGYELLNWQGIIRKFSKTISTSDKIICCSRANLYPLYEMADAFIDISEVKLFRRSTATGYGASFYPSIDHSFTFGRKLHFAFHRRLKAKLKSFILKRLREIAQLESQLSWWEAVFKRGVARPPSEPCTFIFSSDKIQLNGCIFGYSRNDSKHDIYDLLDLDNNVFQKIEPDFRVLHEIEEKIGWKLTEPFVLCQARRRNEIVPQLSKDTMPQNKLVDRLAQEVKVILLSFHTGRRLDSYSEFEDSENSFRYLCQSFPEQACLIHFAKHCLFFTEGDFGSHIYVPPFLGKDVTVIAPWTVYQLGTTPIDFWNQNAFQFGGQIIPKVSEDVFSSKENMGRIADDILEMVKSPTLNDVSNEAFSMMG